MKTRLTFPALFICLLAQSQINIREIDKSLAKINDKLYASAYEVSNAEYMQFITALKKSNQNDKLAIAQIDSVKWQEKNTYNEPYVKFYHNHPAYKNYPVVNISYQAALLYCDWLNEQYNVNPGRVFKKVKFRLPTEQEWIKAAQAGDSAAVYPWAGNSLKSDKGKYNANFIGLEADYKNNAVAPDNADVTAPVKSYKPNKFGIYNMSGNVAEMLRDETMIKGGSWHDGAEYLAIQSKQAYDGKAKPTVGFRYFVDVIEK